MVYQIKVQGQVDSSWSDWIAGMEVTSTINPGEGWTTTFTGHVTDQASLRGIVNHLWDLNLVLLSVNRIEPPEDH